MDYRVIIFAITIYFAVLGFGIGCAWLMHRRTTARTRKVDLKLSRVAVSRPEEIHG